MNTIGFFTQRRTDERSTSKGFNWRYVTVVMCILGAVLTGLVLQMWRWQVNSHAYYDDLAKAQYLVNERLPTSRGTICAADGSVLAVDEPVWGVYASVSSDVRERERVDLQRDTFIYTVSQILTLDPEKVDKQLTADFRYVPLKHEVSVDDKRALEDAGLLGLYFVEEEKRIYPQGQLAAQLIGFVGRNDNGEAVGNYGLEGYYAGDLLGMEGYSYEEKDSRGNVILTGEYDPVYPRSGKNIVLTLEPAMQSRVETSLAKSVKAYKAKSGSAIVMDPRTGAILVMATFPTYNPGYYWKEENADVFRNRAISDVYEYGSVNKALTISMALEEGAITPKTVCHDKTGSMQLYDQTIYTWDKMPDGDLLPKDILKYSNNVCAAETGLKVGIERFYSYLEKFGIGNFVGIGLQDEATSYLAPLEKWTKLDLAVSSFGQSISATPLQIISAISTIANDGVRMRPYIVQKIYDESEEITIQPEAIGRVVSEETAQEVQGMMEVVVREGEAKWWFDQVKMYSIAGKTGTAQIPYKDKAGYYDDKTNVTFVGFSPVHDAKMIMIVRLEEPKTDTFSASTAVPAWIDIYKEIVLDLGIAPES